ncbi:calcium-responsive transcription factor-like [Paramuricea clavata]|uniref:Calcium-responsive transcription factor-like n=1 Tax=Paramuricea clavata TaxID=317549 RepID=A0A7D9E6R1_PARCT|nr:calcium-responsive transcription factor-like [Paramuricea clavata]
MIEGEYTETHSNSAIVDENSSQMEAKNSILAETNIETESTSQLEVNTSTVLIEDSIEIQSKTSPNQTGEICENPTELNTTVLSTKELVYSANTSTILSLSESDALNSDDGPIVPAISAMSANNVKFETQSVSSTTDSGLLEGFINTSQKDELSVENIENTVLDRENRDQIDDRGTENIDDNLMVTESEDITQEDLGDLPLWAAQLKGCERIGDSYRGYVHTETELDVLLSMHKENTHSSWGTRQSPSSQKPSVRFMWKSQYVPYDGVPFLNSGRRATVMECQYGPRRKGNKVKVEYNENGKPVKRAHRPTCPARIYIKRVRKFPEYKVDKSYEGTPGLRLAQERALTALRVACLDSRGEERFYIQFPLETAHEYHHEDDEMIPHQALSLLPTQVNLGSSRLDPRVVEKINELVARGVTDIYQVKHGVISFIEKDLFLGVDEPTPARHNKSFFPTITDLQNHIYQAMLALESGTLESLPPPESPLKSFSKDERSSKRKCTEPRRVRAPKTPYRTICIRTDDPLYLARDSSLQDTQGQVYVVVPSASGLFPNSESLINTPLDGNKTTSLVQVLTVPASSGSAFLGQQVDGTLDLTGQFLALPMVNCESQEQISTSQDSGIVVHHDSLGKEPISVIPAPVENALNKHHTIDSETPNEDVPTTVTMPSTISPIAIQRLPSTITMATSHPGMTTSTNPNIGVAVPSKNYKNFPTAAVLNTNSTTMPDLVMTSSAVPIASTELIIPNKSLDLEVTATSEIVTSSEIALTSSNLTASITSSDTSMTSDGPIGMTPSQDFPMSYDPTTSSTILMTSPDEEMALKTEKSSSKTIANIDGDFTNTPLSPANSQPNP